ncbi:MAG: WbuC family cupin fold metalloprotein [Gammaproteobacteria bacterium]|nr:WbuC family cupin fold metalloprotein [Gammaproteobacteria bacterium]
MKNIDNNMLFELSINASQSPRRRAHLNLHPQLEDPVQRLLVAMEPDSYVRPHRYAEPGKWELFIVIKGKFQAFIFDQQGTILDTQILSVNGEFSIIIEIPPLTWHGVIALEPGSVFFETKPGPYIVTADKDFADWAPEEQTDGVATFMSWLKTAKVSDNVKDQNK